MNLKILLLFSLYYVVDSSQCPRQENIVPCICFEQHSYLHVHCTSILSVIQIQYMVHEIRGYKFATFDIDKSNFEYIPSNIFQNISIEKLTISKSNFSRIGNPMEPQFIGLENSLETLIFRETFSQKEHLPSLDLGHLMKLQTLEFHKSYVGTVHNSWFKDGPSSLRVVRFVESHLKNVGYKALESLKNLRIVDLSNNAIEYLTRTIFPEPALHLEELNLERNAFSRLEEGIFDSMPKLSRVNLELNEIFTLDEKVWRPIWNNLQYLNIDYNPIICDRAIKWMYANKEQLKNMLEATCYKPYQLMDRDLYSLEINEIK